MGVRISPEGTGTRHDERFEWPPQSQSRDRPSATIGAASTFGSSAPAARLPNTRSVARQSVSRRSWRKPIGLVAFGMCALAVTAAGWYIGQGAPEGAMGALTNLGQAAPPVAHAKSGASTELPTRTAKPPLRRVTASALTGSAAPYAGPSPATGTLVIQSDPAGASITIDGRRSGVTPATLRHVVVGSHRIAITRGALTIQQATHVEDGATVTVVASLRSPSIGSGWVSLRSPLELDVFESGELIGTTRSARIMLQEGPHTLALSNTAVGYRAEVQVRIVAGEITPLNLTLPSSSVHVNAIPWAEVWIDGTRIGETPIGNLQLDVGAHEVLFRHPELGEKTVSTLVKAGVPARVTVDLRVP